MIDLQIVVLIAAQTRICPRCREFKYRFNSNGYCVGCEKQRNRENYLRKLQMRYQPSISQPSNEYKRSTYQVEASELLPIKDEVESGFPSDPKPFFTSNYASRFLRAGKEPWRSNLNELSEPLKADGLT